MAKWYPLDVRGDKKKKKAYDALLDGVPPHLRQFLTDWLRAALTDDFNHRLSRARLQDLERNLRVALTWFNGEDGALKSFLESADRKPDRLLSAIDYALQHWPPEEESVTGLAEALEQGASLWKVYWDGEKYLLVRRMDESVQKAIDRTIDKSGRAGEHLRNAFTAVYGRNPDASKGYRESVRAVEVASIAVISPNDKKATLGTVIGVLKDPKKAKQFKLTLGADTKVDPGDVLRQMNELLWTNQLDRHGTTDESVPLTVSRPQAEAAFHLACTLVHWFTTGKVTKI